MAAKQSIISNKRGWGGKVCPVCPHTSALSHEKLQRSYKKELLCAEKLQS